MLLGSLLVAGCQPHRVDFFPDPMDNGRGEYSVPSPHPGPAGPGPVWWSAFDDATLDSLIRAALENNYDVRQALARLAQASSLTRQAQVAHLPQVSLRAGAERQWGEGEGNGSFVRVGGALAWEIDAFQRLGSTALARQSEAIARREDVEAVRLSLSAEVAETYFDAVEQRRQLALLRQQMETDRELLALTELRFSGGLTASVDVWQQSSQLAETESLVPPAEAALRVSENRLDLLLGQLPDTVDRVTDAHHFALIGELPSLGIPSDLLLQRPDLRALRSGLVAADAEIGRAIAERLPRLILDGSSWYADGPDFSGPVGALLGTFVQPLLDWGARKAEVERNRALYSERLAAFTQAYLVAIGEVENTLYQERKQGEYLDRLERRHNFLQRTVAEARDRYSNGLTDFLPVLTAVKELQQIERILVRQQRELLGFRIRLHRALGGKSDVQ